MCGRVHTHSITPAIVHICRLLFVVVVKTHFQSFPLPFAPWLYSGLTSVKKYIPAYLGELLPFKLPPSIPSSISISPTSREVCDIGCQRCVWNLRDIFDSTFLSPLFSICLLALSVHRPPLPPHPAPPRPYSVDGYYSPDLSSRKFSDIVCFLRLSLLS